MSASNPTVTIPIIPANQTISTGPQRVLFVGQMLAGTATPGTVVTDVGNSGQEDPLFGSESMLAGGIRRFRAVNKLTPIDVIPLSDLTGATAAQGNIVFTGTATFSASLFVSVGSKQDYTFELVIPSGTAASVIASALAALVNANTKCPYNATSSSGTVTLTYVHAGSEGNFANLRVEGYVAGIGYTVGAFSGGAGSPVVTGIFSQVADTRYQTVVWPTSYADTEVLTNFLDGRFNVTDAILDGICVKTIVGSPSACAAYGNGKNDLNLVPIYVNAVADTAWKGNANQELPYVNAADFAAIRSLRLTEGSNIASYITTVTGNLDARGGPALASYPYANTPMANTPIIPAGKGFSRADLSILQAAGGVVFINNPSRTAVILSSPSTTYKTNAAGVPDVTFKYLEFVDTEVTVREFFFNNFKSQYAQSRLTEGTLIPNRSMANKESIAAYTASLYSDLSGSDYVLLQAGEDARLYFKNNLSVGVNLAKGLVTLSMVAPIVTQLREMYVPMSVSFSVGLQAA